MLACTIVARNYLAQAGVLASSFLEHHPDARFVTLVIDGVEADRTPVRERAEVWLPGDVELADGEWEQMAGIYAVLELATAIKAAFLRSLFAAHAHLDAVVFLDPDIEVFAPFPEVFETAARDGIALTPHVLQPLPRDGMEPDERMLRHAGLFNLGFIAVGRRAGAFLDWWHERLRTDAVVDLSDALFSDQRWVDWVPSLFGCTVLRDPGLNVAYWNIHERPLVRAADGTVHVGSVDGPLLRFFHFSGYDPTQPWILSTHVIRAPRGRLPELPVVTELCAAYAKALDAAAHATRRTLPYGLATSPSGIHLTPVVRAAYRAAVLEAEANGDPVPPAPFGPDGGAAFRRWLTTPIRSGPDAGLCPWEAAVWRSRGDLQAAFPRPADVHAHAYGTWLRHDPGAEAVRREIGLGVADVGHRAPGGPREDYGWNVVGYLAAELGVGDAARRMHRAVEAAGVLNELVAARGHLSREEHPLARRPVAGLRFRDSLYCVNADQLAATMATLGDAVGVGRRIGVWFWEVDRFPDEMRTAFDLVDEVWTTSAFTTGVLEPVATVPVRTVTLPVAPPSAPTPFRRHQIGLPEGFTFLFSYDFHSVPGRKNPLGLIDAYTRAFGPGDGATLVMKSINGAAHPGAFDRVRHAAAGRPDIVIADGYLDAARLQAMIELADCYVSLHRAEGFGLGMAAAMAAGRPVVATGWSGNLQFMDERSALLVPFELVPVGPGMAPYPSDAHWADPDLDVAAGHLRAVFDDAGLARRIGEAGRAHVAEHQSLARACEDIAPTLLGVPV